MALEEEIERITKEIYELFKENFDIANEDYMQLLFIAIKNLKIASNILEKKRIEE